MKDYYLTKNKVKMSDNQVYSRLASGDPFDFDGVLICRKPIIKK